MKNMQQVFQKYITYKRDHNQLLLFLLSQLVRETLSYLQARSGLDMPGTIEVDMDEFMQRVSFALQEEGKRVLLILSPLLLFPSLSHC